MSQNPSGYSGTPLPKKLGIKPSSAVALLDAPEGFETTLGDLPAGATLHRDPDGPCPLTIWFVRQCRDLEAGMRRISQGLGPGGLWIAWPKRASGVPTDLTENAVREAGLAVGLVDFKVCAIDATWSGLRFARRRHPVERG